MNCAALEVEIALRCAGRLSTAALVALQRSANALRWKQRLQTLLHRSPLCTQTMYWLIT